MEVFTALKEMNWRKESCAIKAGGTDLLVWIKKRAAAPEWIIDLSRIPELGCVVFSREKGLFIGAMATVNEVAIHPDVVSIYPGIAEACLSHSDQLIRNKATVVGNVCSAVPSGDLLPILGAYEAEICLLSENEERFVKIENFITGPRRTVLEKNEIVSGVVVPVPSGISTSTYLKLGRRSALDLWRRSALPVWHWIETAGGAIKLSAARLPQLRFGHVRLRKFSKTWSIRMKRRWGWRRKKPSQL